MKSRLPPNPAVLCRLYVNAVLPCLTALAAHDPVARDILGTTAASITLRVLGGPAATIHLQGGTIGWERGAVRGAKVVLLFLSEAHLNAFFAGRRWALPVTAWGVWRVPLLICFARLGARLDAVLNGHPEVLAAAAGRALHARLILIAAGLGLQPLASGDAATQAALRNVPAGLAAFTIAGEQNATVWFDHGSPGQTAGWGEAPRRPDVTISFVDADTAYAALREEIDTYAAVGAGRIQVEGLVPLADGLNFAMERLGVYLQT